MISRQHIRVERLKSRKALAALFSHGQNQKAYPLALRFAPNQQAVWRVAFAVPKKKIRRAVDRNLLKRRMREAFRLLQQERGLPQDLPPQDLLFVYLPAERKDFAQIKKGMQGHYEALCNLAAP